MVAPFEALERTYPEVAPEPPLTGQSGHGLAAGATLFANALETGTDATDVDAEDEELADELRRFIAARVVR